eukprot:1231032-Prymnesium_polylepis.2
MRSQRQPASPATPSIVERMTPDERLHVMVPTAPEVMKTAMACAASRAGNHERRKSIAPE